MCWHVLAGVAGAAGMIVASVMSECAQVLARVGMWQHIMPSARMRWQVKGGVGRCGRGGMGARSWGGQVWASVAQVSACAGRCGKRGDGGQVCPGWQEWWGRQR